MKEKGRSRREHFCARRRRIPPHNRNIPQVTTCEQLRTRVAASDAPNAIASSLSDHAPLPVQSHVTRLTGNSAVYNPRHQDTNLNTVFLPHHGCTELDGDRGAFGVQFAAFLPHQTSKVLINKGLHKTRNELARALLERVATVERKTRTDTQRRLGGGTSPCLASAPAGLSGRSRLW